MYRNQGYPFGMVSQMEVRAFIVATKSRNGDGAKGGRKMDGRRTNGNERKTCDSGRDNA